MTFPDLGEAEGEQQGSFYLIKYSGRNQKKVERMFQERFGAFFEPSTGYWVFDAREHHSHTIQYAMSRVILEGIQ